MPRTQHIKHERTLVIIKPDAIQRMLVGEIIKRFERIGLKISGIKMIVPTVEHVEAHYTLDPQWRMDNGLKSIKGYTDRGQKHPLGDDPLVVSAETLRKLKLYVASGPVIPLVLEGVHAVEIVRKITGNTEPRGAVPGTIRGDFSLDSYNISDVDKRSVRNIIHASGSAEEAEKEIKHWFKPEEIIDYRLLQESILYDKDLDGIFE